MTATRVETVQDIVAFLHTQHEQVKQLFARVTQTHGRERREAFTELRRFLAVHETAEEEIVHPRARRTIDDGESIVTARLQEEHEAKKALGELEKIEDVDSTDFETKFAKLQEDVLAHAGAEEQVELSRLGTQLEDSELQRMRKAAEIAESLAPTRPHAGVESATANLVAGPFAAMADRVRDAISGRR